MKHEMLEHCGRYQESRAGITRLLLVMLFMALPVRGDSFADSFSLKSNNPAPLGELTNAISAVDAQHSEPTNEVLVLSTGTGVLVKFDTNGLILRSGFNYTDCIPLNSLNNEDLKALLQCKLGYTTLAYFDQNNHNQRDPDTNDHFAHITTQIWESGHSLQDKMQARLTIFSVMNDYNKAIALYNKYKRIEDDCQDKIARKYFSIHNATEAQVAMVDYMIPRDPLSKARDAAYNQQEAMRSRINKLADILSSFGFDVAHAPADPVEREDFVFVSIPPFHCMIK